ncbi:MAG: type II/IV secretion system protein [Candidatus Colwellbacteria bacterium]|nr:type II/IV secretion system protein [Candidatus Colwellbacteria bacterium]
MHIPDEKLKTILYISGAVSESDFETAIMESKRSGQSIIDVLLGRELIPEYYLVELLGKYFDVPAIDLKSVTIPKETLLLIPEAYAKSEHVVAFNEDKEKGAIKVAMLDPADFDAIDFLRAKTNSFVEPYITTSDSLRYGLQQYKETISTDFNEVIAENVEKAVSASGETDIAKLAEAVPVIAILDSIVEHGIQMSASDIHFEPLPKELLIRYRIDGVLHEILSLPKQVDPIVVARVKVLANLQIDEHRIPQDGRFRFGVEGSGTVDVRVNVMPVLNGEKVEMRLLRSSTKPLTLEELGFSKEATEIINREITKPHGMILVTGPTGHGKTTTLYAILYILNTSKVNITTIEDPIEYEIPRVNQTQVNVKAGVTFPNGLRSILRQNPDIILIGEIRDNETVDIAVHASLTGHLVLSSLHTNDAPSALPRLIDMGAPAFLLASTVNLIIAQRLVRKICTSCIESYPMTPEIERLIQAQLSLANANHIKSIPKILYRGKGCNICGSTGFRGQLGIFEILSVSESIRALLLKLVSVHEMRAQAIKEGMKSMFEDGLEKVERGITSIEEVLRVVRE